MSLNVSSLLTLNPIIVNMELGLYGLLFVVLFIYVHLKFRKAGRLLTALQKDWTSATSIHAGMVGTAQARISRLTVKSQAVVPFASAPSAVTSDTRSQVTAMGRRGTPVHEIARSCGLPEGEVDVLLGMARIQRTEVIA